MQFKLNKTDNLLLDESDVEENIELVKETIINRPRNGYETVDNIKVVFIDCFKQLEVASIIDYATN